MQTAMPELSTINKPSNFAATQPFNSHTTFLEKLPQTTHRARINAQ